MPLSLFPTADAATRARLEADPVIALVNRLDWAATELGPVATWPEALRSAARLVLTSAVPMALLIGPRGVMLYNTPYAPIAGKRHPSVMGQSVLEGWPEVAEFNADIIRRVIEGGESLSFDNTPFTFYRNGVAEKVYLNLDYTPVLDEAGRGVAVLALVQEVTEQVAAAQEREVVAQELSHRIKNIFAVIGGIVALAARTYPEASGLAAELRARIISLGKAHDFVRPHSSASAHRNNPSSLRHLIGELMSPYKLPGDDRIDIAGDDAVIDEGAATPLALIFHELGTNAAKYGALSKPGGRVAIDIASDDETCRVAWREIGGPPGPLSDKQGFGSRLMSLSVEGQLKGRLTRRWEPDGLLAELEFPLASLTRKATLHR